MKDPRTRDWQVTKSDVASIDAAASWGNLRQKIEDMIYEIREYTYRPNSVDSWSFDLSMDEAVQRIMDLKEGRK